MMQLRTTRSITFIAINLLTLGLGACGSVSTTHSTDPAASPAAVSTPASTPATASTPAAGATPDPVAFSAASYTVQQDAGSVQIKVRRSGAATSALSVHYETTNGSAREPGDYTAESGTLQWTENDLTSRTISVPISKATPFSGDRSFYVELNDPSTGWVISPGTATVTIAGDASAGVGSLQFANSAYTVAQNNGTVTVSVNRADGAVGSTSVAYATANGSAVAGTDYTATHGTLAWAAGDSSAKTFKVALSSATPFSGTKSFQVALADATAGARVGSPASAAVSINGDKPTPGGDLHLNAASYTVGQAAGKLTIEVARSGASSEAASVDYATSNGTATAGSNYTATSGTLHWAAGDTSLKSFAVAVSTTPFSGTKTFNVALSAPSAGAALSSPGRAAVSIAGDSAAGSLELSAATYAVSQRGGSLVVGVRRVGGSSGTAKISYAQENGSALAGRDFTATSGVLSWASGDTSTKTFAIPVSNATPFAGGRSFTVVLTNPSSGAALGSPATANATINGDATSGVGSLQFSSSGYQVGQAAGSARITVNRTGGSSGAISVSYATANGTADAGSNYTATSGKLSWASGDASSKAISIPVSNATPFTGSKAFTVAMSGVTGGATLANPDSAAVTINGSGSTPPGSASWVYYDGVFNWGGDYSFEATANYRDSSGRPLEGPYDIAVTVTAPWGGFLPYAGGKVPLWNFNDAGYNYLTLSFKPTIANQKAQVYFVKVGDIPVGAVVDLFSGQYGPAPQPGVWSTYKIPLSQLGVLNTSIYKFAIQDMTGSAGHVFYLDNIGFE